MLTVLLLLLLLPILLAPLETAGWWAQRRKTPARLEPPPPVQERAKSSGRAAQLVYFTGVAGYSGEFLARREEALLGRIAERFPELTVHSDLFPYSVNNTPLHGERLFAWLWRFLHRRRLQLPNSIFDVLIVVRNIGQLLVSADPRYGPTYNRGLSEELQARLSPELPTIFLAYSGGAQMAVGAAGPYSERASAPLHLLALGGVFTDDPNIALFQSVTQLQGTRDRWIVELGKLIFPGLWALQPWSAWNRYRRSGRFRLVCPGPHLHVGKRDYFAFTELPAQEAPRSPGSLARATYADATFSVLASRLEELLDGERSSPGPGPP